MEGDDVRIPSAFLMIQFASCECRSIVRQSKRELRVRLRDAWELSEKLRAAFFDEASQLLLVVRKVKKRRRSGVFLALKEHRRARHQQQQCGNGFVSPRG